MKDKRVIELSQSLSQSLRVINQKIQQFAEDHQIENGE